MTKAEKSPHSPEVRRLRTALERESSDSLALLRDLQDNPICSVRVDETIPCLALMWKGYATSNQFRFVHENILDLLRQHRLSKIIGDDTELPMIHAEDQVWVIEDWMPRAVAAGLRAATSKSPTAYFGKMGVDNVIRSVVPVAITIRSLDDLDAARAWIKNAAC